MTTVDYKALAERVKKQADEQDMRAQGMPLSEWAEEARRVAADLRTVVSLLETMAKEKPVAWVEVADSHEGPYVFHGKELLPSGRHDLYLPPAPQPQPQPQEPIGYMRPDELRQAKDAPALCRVHPAKDRQLDMVPVFAAAQPAQPQEQRDDETFAQATLRDLRALRQEQREPNRMLCATHYCKDCHALWRENDDFSFSLRSPKCCEACNNAPFGDQLYPLTMVAPKSEPTEAQIECHGLDTPERVCFYEQEFYVLSNFSAFSINWKGRRFPTSEHAYHWEKFPQGTRDGELFVRDVIVDAESAHAAFKMAEGWRQLRRPDWDEIKVEVMREILRAKAMQHEYVRRKLLATGDRELVENSWRDDFWGWGPNRNGQNMLGKLWMEVRAELRAALAARESK